MLEEQISWNNILDDIEDQLCVLFIGPEITHISGLPLNKYLNQKIIENNKADILFYYETDGFFLFKDAESKVRVARQIKRIYRTIEKEDSIYRKIVEIPFPLIISLNSDTILSDTHYNMGVQHRPYYFRHNRPLLEDIDNPNRYLPIIFNLCGSQNDAESLILDYEDLFSLLQTSLGTPGLPDRIRSALRNASTFIFLGFQLERWYTQLLIRLLSERPGVEKFAINTVVGDPHTKDFLLNQFKIKFPNGEKDFLTELHEKTKERGINRTVIETGSTKTMQVLRHIQNGSLEEALKLLLELQPEKDGGETISLMARFAQWKKGVSNGTLYTQEANVEFNRLVDATLDLARSIK